MQQKYCRILGTISHYMSSNNDTIPLGEPTDDSISVKCGAVRLKLVFAANFLWKSLAAKLYKKVSNQHII